jgi:hypothetical protein
MTWIGAGFIVLGILASSVFVFRLVNSIPNPPTRVDNGPVRIDGVGLTIFALRRDAGQTCTARDANGAAIALKEPSRREQWDTGARTYYVVAHSVEKIPPQSVDVTCTNHAVTYFVGRRHTLGTFLPTLLAAFASFGVPTAIGCALMVIDYVRRKRAAGAARPHGGR